MGRSPDPSSSRILELKCKNRDAKFEGNQYENNTSNNCSLSRSSIRFAPSEQKNDSVSLASSLEPVYFSGYPTREGSLAETTEKDHQQTFYNDYNQPYHQNINNHDGSFYAVIGPQGIMHQVRPDFAANQHPLNPASFNSYELSSNSNHRGRETNRANWPTQVHNNNNNKISDSLSMPHMPDHLMTSDTPKQLHAIAVQQTKPLNFSSTINSGQVILSKQMRGPSGESTVPVLEAISLNELRAIMSRLKPLDVQEGEADATTDDEELEQDTDEESKNPSLDKQDLEIVRRHQNRLQRTLPDGTFYASAGKEYTPIQKQESVVSEDSGLQVPSTGEDDLAFLRNLVNIDERAPRAPIAYEGGPDQVPLSDRVPMMVAPVQLNADNRQASASRIQNESNKLADSIPIDKLVDHLMSNSRLASFGVQHEDVDLPRTSDNENENDDEDDNSNNNVDDDDDEEEAIGEGEEDEDDPDGESQEADESTPRGTRVSPALRGAVVNKTQAMYSPMMNNTGNWIPMDSLGVRNDNKSMDAEEDRKKEKEKERGKKRKRKRKRRRKKKKKKASVFGLVVGNRMLNRTEVIQLIRILNKMANKGKASKERDASRKLLRFLIKLVLEEYKKDKLKDSRKLNREKNRKKLESDENHRQDSKTNPKDPIRDLLRSVLQGPVDTKTKNTTEDNSIELRPLSDADVPKDPSPETTTSKAPENELDNSRASDESSKREESKEPERKELGELSDELENYFDNDFFEDMADKGMNTSSPTSRGSRSRGTYDRKAGVKITAPKRRRASRANYRLPVPIFGQQITNKDGDDIDPDLDQEQMPRQPQSTRHPPMRKIRPANRQWEESSRRRPHKRRPRPIREDPDEEEPEDEPEGDERHQAEREDSGKQSQHEQDSRNLDESHSPESSNNVNEEYDQNEQPEADDQAAGEEDAPEEAQDNPDSHEDETRKTINEPNERSRKKSNHSGERRVSAKRRYPAKVARKRKRDKLKSSRRRMAESRYEIPPPIVAGRAPEIIDLRRNNVSKNNKRKATNRSVEPDELINNDKFDFRPLNGSSRAVTNQFRPHRKPIRVRAKNKKHRPKPKKTNDNQKINKKRKDRSVKVKNKIKKKKQVDSLNPVGLSPSAKPGLDSESDADYYNESSRYVELCDDDGKCRVKSRKSNLTSDKDG